MPAAQHGYLVFLCAKKRDTLHLKFPGSHIDLKCQNRDFTQSWPVSSCQHRPVKDAVQCRLYVISQYVSLLYELGIVACTLVHFFNLQHPSNAARENSSLSLQRSSIGVTFASLATTLFTFALNLVGASKTVAAVAAIVARVSERTQVSPHKWLQESG